MRRGLLLLSCLPLAGCLSTASVTRWDSISRRPKPGPYAVAFLFEPPADRPYAVIASAEGYGDASTAWYGARDQLLEAAAELGADAVIADRGSVYDGGSTVQGVAIGSALFATRTDYATYTIYGRFIIYRLAPPKPDMMASAAPAPVEARSYPRSLVGTEWTTPRGFATGAPATLALDSAGVGTYAEESSLVGEVIPLPGTWWVQSGTTLCFKITDRPGHRATQPVCGETALLDDTLEWGGLTWKRVGPSTPP